MVHDEDEQWERAKEVVAGWPNPEDTVDKAKALDMMTAARADERRKTLLEAAGMAEEKAGTFPEDWYTARAEMLDLADRLRSKAEGKE